MVEGIQARIRQQRPIPLDAEINCIPGEILALVGPSGSGKSTLLRCLAGIHSPESGVIQSNGEIWLDTGKGTLCSPAERRIGMVFQNYALFPHLTALENVQEGMDQPNTPSARNVAMSLLRKVHLEGLETRRPHELSGGQQQRVGLARALARNPQVLLLDEPFSAVDRVTRERLYGELVELRQELAMPIILVTHDLDEAITLADRMTLLYRGRTLQSGPPLQLLQRPVNMLAARLMGLENRFSGRVTTHSQEQQETRIAWNGLELKTPINTQYAAGDEITWMIPAASVLLMPPDRPGKHPMDIPLSGTITRILGLSETLKIRVEVNGDTPATLIMNVPRHVFERFQLRLGGEAPLRLRGAHIHIMPPESQQ